MARSCTMCGDVIETLAPGYETVCNYCFNKYNPEVKETKPKRHTYINMLQDDVIALKARIEELEAKEADIVTYLSLPKFATETWVSKYDILRMLDHF